MDGNGLTGSVTLTLSLVSGVAMAAESLPAFPGAEGFGADTPGGQAVG